MYQVNEKENSLKLLLAADTFEGEKSPAYIGVRVTDMAFAVSTDVCMEQACEGRAGLVYLHDEQNYVKWVLAQIQGNFQLSLIHVEDGIANTLYSKVIKEQTVQLKLELKDMLIRAYANGECMGKAVSAEDLTSERKGGFTGCTIGVYAEGTGVGHAVFSNTIIQ